MIVCVAIHLIWCCVLKGFSLLLLNYLSSSLSPLTLAHGLIILSRRVIFSLIWMTYPPLTAGKQQPYTRPAGRGQQRHPREAAGPQPASEEEEDGPLTREEALRLTGATKVTLPGQVLLSNLWGVSSCGCVFLVQGIVQKWSSPWSRFKEKSAVCR